MMHLLPAHVEKVSSRRRMHKFIFLYIGMFHARILLIMMNWKWRQRLRSTLITVGWALCSALVILRTFYENTQDPFAWRYYLHNPVYSGFSVLNLLLIFVISVIAGILLIRPESILIGCTGSLALSGLVMFVILSQPAFFSGDIVVQELVYFRSITIVFKMMVPIVILLSFVGGILGGITGERLRWR